MDRIRRRPGKIQYAAPLGMLIHRDGKHPPAFYGTPMGPLRGLSNQQDH
ncbi:MAG: hypothetical protein KDE51_06370 [Anaerolineales bacterium]|nr:hypothetical protein [Anaerolineales bacterium]